MGFPHDLYLCPEWVHEIVPFNQEVGSNFD